LKIKKFKKAKKVENFKEQKKVTKKRKFKDKTRKKCCWFLQEKNSQAALIRREKKISSFIKISSVSKQKRKAEQASGKEKF